MSNISEGSVSLTNTAVEVQQQQQDFSNKTVRRFKPKANQTSRIHFTSEEVVLRRRHFNPIDKKYYRCLEYQGYCPICMAASNKVGEGSMRIKKASETFGANILVYDTDTNGIPTQPLNAEVNFWAFGSDKFVAIRGIMQEWGSLTGLDLNIVCTDEQFQKVTITPGKKCYYAEDAQFKVACDKKIETDSYPLDKFLCHDKSVVELVQIFNLDPAIYIPPEMLNQMHPPIGQDMANNIPSYQTSQPAAPIPQAPAQAPVQQAPAQVPQQPYTPPQAGGANFADLENLSKLL